MAETLKLGNGIWATKENSLLSYNDENGNYKPLPFDFTRASSATVVNKQGLIETVQSGTPRIDFLGNTNGALLLEPQRTNGINYSEPTSSETSAGGITYESFNWSLGFTNCIKFGDNSQSRYRYFTGTVANSTEYTISAFVIMDDLSEPVLGINSSSGDLILRVGGTTATTGNLPNVNMGNNIYRVSSVITSDAGGGSTGLLKYSNASNKGFRVVGFQLEQASYPTSYIPTQGSTVTRVVDSTSQTLPNEVFNSYPFSMFAEIDVIDANTANSAFSLLNKASSNNYFTIEYFSNLWHITARPNGPVERISSTTAVTKGTNKLVGVWESSSMKLYLNGSLIASGSNSQSFNNTVDSLILGQLRISGDTGTRTPIRQALLYNTALTDSEAIAITT